jgi:hypothetical protein
MGIQAATQLNRQLSQFSLCLTFAQAATGKLEEVLWHFLTFSLLASHESTWASTVGIRFFLGGLSVSGWLSYSIAISDARLTIWYKPCKKTRNSF